MSQESQQHTAGQGNEFTNVCNFIPLGPPSAEKILAVQVLDDMAVPHAHGCLPALSMCLFCSILLHCLPILFRVDLHHPILLYLGID